MFIKPKFLSSFAVNFSVFSSNCSRWPKAFQHPTRMSFKICSNISLFRTHRQHHSVSTGIEFFGIEQVHGRLLKQRQLLTVRLQLINAPKRKAINVQWKIARKVNERPAGLAFSQLEFKWQVRQAYRVKYRQLSADELYELYGRIGFILLTAES
jgi:hypothetical protein